MGRGHWESTGWREFPDVNAESHNVLILSRCTILLMHSVYILSFNTNFSHMNIAYRGISLGFLEEADRNIYI